ncbi:MAG: hypothetical protein AAFX79_03355 [Planctomycetota bacterium]
MSTARTLLMLCLAWTAALAGCGGTSFQTDLAALYEQAGQNIGPERNPVVVIPGVLGSKLEAFDGRSVWGAFVYGAADADKPDGARLVAVPMRRGVPLSQLTDDVEATDVLDQLTLDVGLLRGLKLSAYVDILMTLAAGQYRDQSLGRSGAINYGGAHYTCFQFPYDWRRDVSEQVVEFHELIQASKAAHRAGYGLPDDAPVKVDVVAHSMGGLVLRYYLRYGPNPLPEDGSLPALTWEGAEHVERAILVGTPNAGSVLSLKQLVNGWDLHPIAPNYRPSVLGTMPAIYQLLPRARHNRVVHAATGRPIDVLDIETWDRFGWGLASDEPDRALAWLLEDVPEEERAAVARDHLEKCLARAEQLHAALDIPAAPPPGLVIHLFAGDAADTPTLVTVDEAGRLAIAEMGPGDDTVTRASALMDERVGAPYIPRLRSPIYFTSVRFLEANHLGLTKSPNFTNNLLYLLLEDDVRGSAPLGG